MVHQDVFGPRTVPGKLWMLVIYLLSWNEHGWMDRQRMTVSKTQKREHFLGLNRRCELKYPQYEQLLWLLES